MLKSGNLDAIHLVAQIVLLAQLSMGFAAKAECFLLHMCTLSDKLHRPFTKANCSLLLV